MSDGARERAVPSEFVRADDVTLALERLEEALDQWTSAVGNVDVVDAIAELIDAKITEALTYFRTEWQKDDLARVEEVADHTAQGMREMEKRVEKLEKRLGSLELNVHDLDREEEGRDTAEVPTTFVRADDVTLALERLEEALDHCTTGNGSVDAIDAIAELIDAKIAVGADASKADRHDLDERLRHVEAEIFDTEERDSAIREINDDDLDAEQGALEGGKHPPKSIVGECGTSLSGLHSYVWDKVSQAEFESRWAWICTCCGVVARRRRRLAAAAPARVEDVPSLEAILAEHFGRSGVVSCASERRVYDRLTALIAKRDEEIARLHRMHEANEVRMADLLASEAENKRLVAHNDRLSRMHLQMCELAKTRFHENAALRAQLDAKVSVRVTEEAIRKAAFAYAEATDRVVRWPNMRKALEAALPHMIGKVGDTGVSGSQPDMPTTEPPQGSQLGEGASSPGTRDESRTQDSTGPESVAPDVPDEDVQIGEGDVSRAPMKPRAGALLRGEESPRAASSAPVPTDPDEPEVVGYLDRHGDGSFCVREPKHAQAVGATGKPLIRLSDHQAAMKRARVVSQEELRKIAISVLNIRSISTTES